jgi:murein DD-endopeptidase MepM/ murein hydrolase activator NlpD
MGLGGMIKKDTTEGCTIVVFRGTKAAPVRFTLSGQALKRIKALGIGLLVVQGLLLTHYVIQATQVRELEELRLEAAQLREQTASFSAAVEELKRRMLSIREINQRLRVMLGIEEQDSRDMVGGKGGSEIPMDAGSPLETASLSLAEPVDGTVSPFPRGEPSGGEGSLMEQLRRAIAWLDQQSRREERRLEELLEVAKTKTARWAATPSIWPVRGWVTSGFGPRISPFTSQPAMHDGLDIGAAPNTPVRAPAGGSVRWAGFDAKMGNTIVIDHGYGIETLYGHLAKIQVRTGQRVNRGDLIGLVGSTGLSTGPHLHYTVRVKGQPVNPLRYILD